MIGGERGRKGSVVIEEERMVLGEVGGREEDGKRGGRERDEGKGRGNR